MAPVLPGKKKQNEMSVQSSLLGKGQSSSVSSSFHYNDNENDGNNKDVGLHIHELLTDALTLHVKGTNVANTTKQQHFEDVCCNIEARVVMVIMHILVDCCDATCKRCAYHDKFHIHISWGGCKVHSRMEISHRTKATTKVGNGNTFFV
eukprot:126022-Ditylum_brightwellii.AAC.1